MYTLGGAGGVGQGPRGLEEGGLPFMERERTERRGRGVKGG